MFGERVQRIPYTGLVEGPHGSRSSWGNPVDVEGAGFDPGGSAMVDEQLRADVMKGVSTGDMTTTVKVLAAMSENIAQSCRESVEA